eukprot:COSAG01_NODE_9511_length_2425_cov_2.271711_1_plen_672_part_00
MNADAKPVQNAFLKAVGLSDLIDADNRYETSGLSGNHFRYEVATGLWSLHSPGKFNPRPKGYSSGNAGKQRTHERPDIKVQGNPFDLENAHMTPPLLDSLPDPKDPSKPQTRCFENKFPVLSRPEGPGQAEVRVSFVDSFFPQVSAIGRHEVVVQHWRYNMCQALMTADEVKTLWKALKRRFEHLSGVSRFVQLLENHGVRSGGSLPHPHSQLLGLPVVPGEQTRRYSVALDHWRANAGECVFDAVLRSVLSSSAGSGKVSRMLAQDEHFVAFVPHAQERANEMWIMPRRQCHSFVNATRAEMDALALMCRSCLRMLYLCHDDPDYNILMRTAPTSKTDQPGDADIEPMSLWYRWHLVIIPHDNHWAWGGIKGYGGFTEVQGTPEQHAAQLRSYKGMSLTTGDSDGEEEEDEDQLGLLHTSSGSMRRVVSRPRRVGTSRRAFLTDAGLNHLIVTTAPDSPTQGYDTKPLEGNHFRYENATGVWCLVSPSTGAAKPRGYASSDGQPSTHERPETEPKDNPFDLANQAQTPPIIESTPDPREPGKPMIRVFENKFPALRKPEQNSSRGSVRVAFVDGLYPQVSAVGLHEVVVQHWRYNTCEALMSEKEVGLLWQTLARRFNSFSQSSRYVQLLANHGELSGGSLPHPLSQLLGLPIVPRAVGADCVSCAAMEF